MPSPRASLNVASRPHQKTLTQGLPSFLPPPANVGASAGAAVEYSALLRADPGHQCYYQKELLLYLHRKLDADIKSFNPDVDLDPYFKEVLPS